MKNKIVKFLGNLFFVLIILIAVTVGYNHKNKRIEPDPQTDNQSLTGDSNVASINSDINSSSNSADSKNDSNVSSVDDNEQGQSTQSETNKQENPKSEQDEQKVDKPTYINGILIANKTYALPADYNPGVDKTANAALEKMIYSAKQEGISLWIVSGFRSYETQKRIYDNNVARDGKAATDRYSARPGHSEHQSGLSFDLNSLDQSFADTKEGKWLAENGWKYGFIIRYPKGKEDITGYMFEPWHVRYLGESTAKAVYNSGLTLEEYLGIDSKYSD